MNRRKPVAADTSVAKRPKRTNNLYVRPEKIPLGTILTDALNKPWKVGPSIGTGGFGDIYCAYCFSNAAPKTVAEYPNVVKIEPHENGPLFVETHFYRKFCKSEDIERYRKLRKLKHLGMPLYLASGSHMLNDVKQRFLVIPRFGVSLQSVCVQNGNCLPISTVYRAALQMLDVLEYIHSNQFVHADLKGDNILFGMGDRGRERLYLVDFGMACRVTLENQFKPDPRNKHNGTIEYTSRDAHQGVMTMRGDLEILAYNLIEWAGGSLPWKEEKMLKNCNKVQQMKEEHMSDVGNLLKQSFRKQISIPKALQPFLECVIGLRYNEIPKYSVCAKIFDKTLKTLGLTNTGALDVSVANTTTVNDSSGPMNKPKSRTRRTLDTSISNGLADTVPNTQDEIPSSESTLTPRRVPKMRSDEYSPSLIKRSKQRPLNGSRAATIPDTVPNTPEDEDDSPVLSQRSKRKMDLSDAAGTSRLRNAKTPVLPISQDIALMDTVPNTPEEDEEDEEEDEDLMPKRKRNLKQDSRDGNSRARQAKRVTVEEPTRAGTRRKPKTITVMQSASSQDINIQIKTPRKKRVRNATSESPKEITIKLTLNANLSVNSRGNKKNGLVVVSASQQNMSLESSRNESLEASQDIVDISSTTEDNNASRNMFDDY
ncbi:serine/threonine-protein kinase VRK1 [Anopheles nili]|uniref:serine/threonine-protein kinase VRK1 n=1 Tax=Anopheles nili TaxID=185578 RepID=UPI00237AE0F9|nr:serine/threonine-protein kinase VRK1 [Anopheles nili]